MMRYVLEDAICAKTVKLELSIPPLSKKHCYIYPRIWFDSVAANS